jgi:hypothetical protein
LEEGAAEEGAIAGAGSAKGRNRWRRGVSVEWREKLDLPQQMIRRRVLERS